MTISPQNLEQISTATYALEIQALDDKIESALRMQYPRTEYYISVGTYHGLAQKIVMNRYINAGWIVNAQEEQNGSIIWRMSPKAT